MVSLSSTDTGISRLAVDPKRQIRRRGIDEDKVSLGHGGNVSAIENDQVVLAWQMCRLIPGFSGSDLELGQEPEEAQQIRISRPDIKRFERLLGLEAQKRLIVCAEVVSDVQTRCKDSRTRARDRVNERNSIIGSNGYGNPYSASGRR